MTKAERVTARKRDLQTAGYSAASAGALAQIDDDVIRSAVAHAAGNSGVADGTARAYLVKLLAWKAGAVSYPTAPKALRPVDARYIADAAARMEAEVEARRSATAAAVARGDA